ncbi:hypothetical protein GGS24DRAFT_504922 [Hypoxylon argillaceum]|nr:hypothetical protein GGS24DRAFT_504922 [Hypoxylon argillaceum]
MSLCVPLIASEDELRRYTAELTAKPSFTPLLNSLMRTPHPAPPAPQTRLFTTSPRRAASRKKITLPRTPKEQVTLACVMAAGFAVDYELWNKYGAKYFDGKGEEEKKP